MVVSISHPIAKPSLGSIKSIALGYGQEQGTTETEHPEEQRNCFCEGQQPSFLLELATDHGPS